MDRLNRQELEKAQYGGVFLRRCTPSEEGMNARVPDDRFIWKCIGTANHSDDNDLMAVFVISDESRSEVREFLHQDAEYNNVTEVEEAFRKTIELSNDLPELNWHSTHTKLSGWQVTISAAGVCAGYEADSAKVAEFVARAGQTFPDDALDGLALINALRDAYEILGDLRNWGVEERQAKLQEAIVEAKQLLDAQRL